MFVCIVERSGEADTDVCMCCAEPFPEYAIVIIVLGSLLLIVSMSAFLVYRYDTTHGYTRVCIRVCTRVYTRVHTGTHGYTRIHTGTHEYARVRTGTHGYTQVHTGTHGYTREHTDKHGQTGTHGYTRVHTGTHGNTRVHTGRRADGYIGTRIYMNIYIQIHTDT